MRPLAEDQHVPGLQIAQEAGVELRVAGELGIDVASISVAIQSVTSIGIEHALSCTLQIHTATVPHQVDDGRHRVTLLGQGDPTSLVRRERSHRGVHPVARRLVTEQLPKGHFWRQVVLMATVAHLERSQLLHVGKHLVALAGYPALAELRNTLRPPAEIRKSVVISLGKPIKCIGGALDELPHVVTSAVSLRTTPSRSSRRGLQRRQRDRELVKNLGASVRPKIPHSQRAAAWRANPRPVV